MATTKLEFIQEGRDSFNHPLRDRGLVTDTTMPEFGLGKSWQAKAFAQGWAEERAKYNAPAQGCPACAAGLPIVTKPYPVQSIAPTAGETLEAGRAAHAEQNARMASENRRADRIAAMVKGYTTAILFTETNRDGEPLDDLGYELHPDAFALADEVCTVFYDRHTADLGAYADLRRADVGTDYHHSRRHLIAYEYAGHDLWLTSQGHGAGFWDRGLGRLGDRLTKAAKRFEGFSVYTDELDAVNLDGPYHATWK